MKNICRCFLHFCFVFILSFLFNDLIRPEVFVPNKQADLSYVPPFIKNLSKYEKNVEKEEGKKTLQTVVKQIVDSDDLELEKKADDLLKDRKKLDQFLTAISKYQHKSDQLIVDIPVAIQSLLDEQYKIKKLMDTKISLNVKQADIDDLIELISKASGLNFVIDPNISGLVTGVHLKDVSASLALRYILANNNPQLALLRDFDVFRIVTLPVAIQVLKGRLDKKFQNDLIQDFFVLHHAKLNDQLKEYIEKMWSHLVGKNRDDIGAYLIFDYPTKKIFFRGYAYQVKSFKHFLNEIDVRIPQVKIEARVVITKKDFEESLGIDWSGIYNRSSTIGDGWNWFGFGNINQTTGGMVPENNIVNWALNFFPTNWKTSGSLSLPFIFGSKNLDHRRLNLKLNAAESKSELKTLLKPTLFVNSNEMAEILVGKEVPIQTIITDYTEAKERNLETINYKELGMKLKVKPAVSPDFKSVFLDIFVEHSSILDGDSKSFDQKTSQILKTTSRNRVLLKSGETTLIGGLITDIEGKDRRGVPFLSRIPIIGLLFGSKRKMKEDEQLLIFITPTVV